MLWALTDHQGSVRQLAAYDRNGTPGDPSDDSTSEIKLVDYDAFGNVVSDSEPGPETLFLYTTRPLDPESGLQNNLHRWYDAQIGRWLGEDPIGFSAGDANLYRYCRNGPLTHLDPSGREELPTGPLLISAVPTGPVGFLSGSGSPGAMGRPPEAPPLDKLTTQGGVCPWAPPGTPYCRPGRPVLPPCQLGVTGFPLTRKW